MTPIKKIFIFTFAILALFSCSKRNADYFTIGSFNMEWLGDGVNDRKDRSEAEYKRMANILLELDADVFCLQEVENSMALERVLKYMPEYSHAIIDTGIYASQQNLAAIYKKELKIENLGLYAPTAIIAGRNRAGLLLRANKNGVDFLIQNVHLKSSSRYDSTKEMQEKSRETRALQAQILSFWADSILTLDSKRNIIILGDFNDSPLRKKFNCLEALYLNKNLKFLTDSLKSCKFKNAYSIDHVVVSNNLAARYAPESLFMFDVGAQFNEEERKDVSDHCPILVKFKVK